MGTVTNLSTSTKPAPISWVESLFARMQALYGNKFLDMWRNTDTELVKQLWADEMGKLTNEELKRGYAALMTRDWPPSLPEYVKMCRPPIDETVSYYEAVNGCRARDKGEMGNWSHPAIYWAASKMAFDLKSLTYSAIKDRWNKALYDEMENGEWPAIPQAMKALPEPGKSMLSRDKAKQMLAELGAAGVLDVDPSKTDHKLWAKRILKRAAEGDKTLTPLQIRFAQEALTA